MSDDEKGERLNEIHNEGQEAGSEGLNFFGRMMESHLHHFNDGQEGSDAYHQGYENGRDNQPKDD